MLNKTNMQEVTFNTMPQALKLIADRLEAVHRLLSEGHELQPTKQHEEELLTIQGAAEFLRLSVPTIYAKVHRRELPFLKRSKRLYFEKAELLAYLKEGRALTTSEAEAAAVGSFGNKRKGLNDGN
jgi:excisionase family DNA binding protein